MKKHLIKIMVCSLALVVAVSSPALARPGKGGWGRDGKGDRKERMHRMVEELNLTEEQQTKMREHRQQHRDEQKALREKIRETKESLRAELEKPEIDQARLQQINNELKDFMGQTLDARIQGILAMREILTPEQFKKFQEKAKEFRGKRGDKRGRWQRFKEKFRKPPESSEHHEDLF